MTFKYEGKIYKLVPDDRTNPNVCDACAFNNDSTACVAAFRMGEPDCIDTTPLSHYEEVKDENV